MRLLISRVWQPHHQSPHRLSRHRPAHTLAHYFILFAAAIEFLGRGAAPDFSLTGSDFFLSESS